MQTREQYILGKIAEEAAEVAQRAIKARDYGLDEVQAGKTVNNAERLLEEFYDLQGRFVELHAQTEKMPPLRVADFIAQYEGKAVRREKYLQYSRMLGLTE